MPLLCTTCHHPKREQVDRALLFGESYRDIAGRFGASHSAVLT